MLYSSADTEKQDDNHVKNLVVVLHGFMAKPAKYDSLKELIRTTYDNTEVIVPRLPLSKLSFSNPDTIANKLIEQIDEKWNLLSNKGLKEFQIVLIGHSTGAILARKLYLEAYKQEKDWRGNIERIILIAGINQGWTINPSQSWKRIVVMNFAIGFSYLMGLFGFRHIITYTRKGSDFMNKFRDEFIELNKKLSEQSNNISASEILMIQLLGTQDNLVAPEDNIDLVTDKDFIYLEINNSDHQDVVSMDGIGGDERMNILKIALTADKSSLENLQPRKLSLRTLEILTEEYAYIHQENFVGINTMLEKNNPKEIEYQTVAMKTGTIAAEWINKIKDAPLVENCKDKNDYTYIIKSGDKKTMPSSLEILKLGRLKYWLIEYFLKEKKKSEGIEYQTTTDEEIDTYDLKGKDLGIPLRKIFGEKIKDKDLIFKERWMGEALLSPYTQSLFKNYIENRFGKRSESSIFEQMSLKSIDIITYDRAYEYVNRLVIEEVYNYIIEKSDTNNLLLLYKEMFKKGTNALCLSGGGIRSATFALGVVQRLAKKENLEEPKKGLNKALLNGITYLSTVSGGGYIGGWLSSWMHNDSAGNVLDELNKTQKSVTEPAPISHLRQYSNYLSPLVGLFSADTWTLLATYIRNLFLNWLILVPFLMAIVAIPWFIVSLINYQVPFFYAILIISIGTLLFVISDYYTKKNPPQLQKEDTKVLLGKVQTQKEFLWNCLLPGALAVMCWTIGWFWFIRGNYESNWKWIRDLQWIFKGKSVNHSIPYWIAAFITGSFVVIEWFFFLYLEKIGKIPQRFNEGLSKGKRISDAIKLFISGGVAGALIFLVFHQLSTSNLIGYGSITYISFSYPAFIFIILLMGFLYEGLRNKLVEDAEREWMARYAGWFLIVAGSWVLISGLVLYVPLYTEQNIGYIFSASSITGYLTAYLGQKSGSPGGPSKNPDVKTSLLSYLPLSSLAFVAFLVLIVLLSHVDMLILSKFTEVVSCFYTEAYAPSMVTVNPFFPLLFIALMGIVCYKFSKYIDSNKFSLHAMYRSRLIRAYLGAGRPGGVRRPNPFTGFDEYDNIYMGNLAVNPQTKISTSDKIAHTGELSLSDEFPKPPAKPFHIINMALNLVNGKNLAWQERKATSFTVSPLHAGSLNLGYRNTYFATTQKDIIPDKNPSYYGGERGITLGTAMTISGAAVSPNMGYNTTPIVAFFMTLFNLRLGAWLGNPGPAGDKTFNNSSPKGVLNPIFKEMFGLTTDQNDYVFLSDGGHFENLGLYEMVLRRNRFIIVSDATCDETGGLEDLGNAIRKIRIDMGVHIDFPLGFDIFSRNDISQKDKDDGKYWAIGRIRYPENLTDYECPNETDKEFRKKDGVLLYIKPGIYGNEPKDIFNYATVHQSFPHETTADQFFSESQFESYRALGFFALDQAIRQLPLNVKDLSIGALMNSQNWEEDVIDKLNNELKKRKKIL